MSATSDMMSKNRKMSTIVSTVMRTRDMRLLLLVVRVFILSLCDTGKLIRVNGDSIMGPLRATVA